MRTAKGSRSNKIAILMDLLDSLFEAEQLTSFDSSMFSSRFLLKLFTYSNIFAFNFPMLFGRCRIIEQNKVRKAHRIDWCLDLNGAIISFRVLKLRSLLLSYFFHSMSIDWRPLWIESIRWRQRVSLFGLF